MLSDLVANGVFPLDQAAARLHHQLVWIHLFPNGNGRHARLMADSLLRQQGAAPFSWGAGQGLDAPGATRQRYIAALRAADAGDAAALLAFARS